jgi:hypothetical protein
LPVHDISRIFSDLHFHSAGARVPAPDPDNLSAGVAVRKVRQVKPGLVATRAVRAVRAVAACPRAARCRRAPIGARSA